jgi:chromate transporter
MSHDIPFREALIVWLRIAALSFGGPAGQIAVMHRILVEEKRWISEGRFLHALNYCMLLPGPEAQQLATYIGWLLHRTVGGLVAGTLFVLPGFVSILALSILYAGYNETALVQALFYGIKAAIFAVVVAAVFRIGRRALKNTAMYAISLAAFAAIFLFGAPFPLIIATAALVGFLGGWLRPGIFAAGDGHAPTSGAAPVVDALLDDGGSAHTRPTSARALGVTAFWGFLWLAPLAALALMLGTGDVFTQIGLFFSKLAVVTFGGAYAVLAYMAQEAVQNYGWLQPGEMLDGLGLAETTPGPLIQVVQFVAFLAAFRDPGALDPFTAGVLASVLATWVTFVPCFLWIFLGAPYVERLHGARALGAALAAITAAVVGVILNLAIWFGLHVIFAEVTALRGFGITVLMPVWSTLDAGALVLSAGAFAALFWLRLGIFPVIGVSAALGAAWYLA